MSKEEDIKNDDIVVSDKEIEDVTREVLKKDEEEKQKQRAALEKEIREKIAKEEEEKRKAQESEALKKALIREKEEKDAAIKKLQEELEETKKQIGSSKAVINTQNPFHKPEGSNNSDDSVPFSQKLTPEQMEDVDELSREKWEEYQRKNKHK